jgi:thiamine-phosphate diphosphorylase
MTREARRRLFHQVDIYPVTCEELSGGRSNLEVLEAVIQGGSKIIQLREKGYPKKDLYHLALKFREMTAKAGVLLIINDHVDIALGVEADGVHLGQDDLPLTVARQLAPFNPLPKASAASAKGWSRLHQHWTDFHHQDKRGGRACFGSRKHCNNQPAC